MYKLVEIHNGWSPVRLCIVLWVEGEDAVPSGVQSQILHGVTLRCQDKKMWSRHIQLCEVTVDAKGIDLATFISHFLPNIYHKH